MTPDPPPLDRIVSLARDLILIPGTANRPLERARCFDLLRGHLEVLDGLCISEHESGGFGSMVVMPRGVTKPEVLMAGHLDVIEHPDPSVYRSAVRDGRLIGPGAGDMKGQLAIMVELFLALQRFRPGLPIGLAITSDEEIGGEHGVRHLFENIGLRCGVALLPDGGSLHDITVAEKGILHARLACQGEEGHAARPWLVPNPLRRVMEAMLRACRDFEEISGSGESGVDHWFPTCVPTILRTPNQTMNCIPGAAEGLLDVRFPPPHTVASVLERLRRAAGPGVMVEAVMSAEPTHLAPDPLFVQVTEEITQQPVRLVRASGGSDARFIARFGIPVVLSRPTVGALHSPDEWVEIASMEAFYRICENYILRRIVV